MPQWRGRVPLDHAGPSGAESSSALPPNRISQTRGRRRRLDHPRRRSGFPAQVSRMFRGLCRDRRRRRPVDSGRTHPALAHLVVLCDSDGQSGRQTRLVRTPPRLAAATPCSRPVASSPQPGPAGVARSDMTAANQSAAAMVTECTGGKSSSPPPFRLLHFALRIFHFSFCTASPRPELAHPPPSTAASSASPAPAPSAA